MDVGWGPLGVGKGVTLCTTLPSDRVEQSVPVHPVVHSHWKVLTFGLVQDPPLIQGFGEHGFLTVTENKNYHC